MKYSSISVIWKNLMRKNNFLIHSKPHRECIYCYKQIHKTALGIPLTDTHPQPPSCTAFLSPNCAQKNNFKMMKTRIIRLNNHLVMYVVILSHRLLLLCKYRSK